MGSKGIIIPRDVAVVGDTAPDTRSYVSPGVVGGQECLNIRRIKAQKKQGFHGGSVVKLKEESEKVGLKLSIQKTKIMASGPITLPGTLGNFPGCL